MRGKLIDNLKIYYGCIKDENGKWRKIPNGLISRCNTSEDNLSKLKTIITTLLGSDLISDETKIYISDPDISMRGVNEKINKARETVQLRIKKRVSALSYNNTIKKISDDNLKIISVLDPNTVRNIVYNRVDDSNLEETEKQIYNLILMFGACDKSRDNLIIKIDNDKIAKNSYCNNSDFFDILSSLENYLKERMNIIENAINSDSEFVEYFNYLLSASAINDRECYSDRERLLNFLHNKDYSLSVTEDNSLGKEYTDNISDIKSDDSELGSIKEDIELDKPTDNTDNDDSDADNYDVDIDSIEIDPILSDNEDTDEDIDDSENSEIII